MTTRGPRTRTRSGCFSYRSRKRKCDGSRPQCSSCLERGEPCRYGIKASFHPSRQLQLSERHGAALSAVERRRGGTTRSVTQFVDDTQHIMQSYGVTLDATAEQEEDHSGASQIAIIADRQHTFTAGDNASQITNEQLAASEGAHPVISAADSAETLGSPSLDYQSTFIEAGDNISSPLPTFVWTRSDVNTSGNFEAISHSGEDLLPIPERKQIQLLAAYLEEAGTWCEVSDADRHFTVSSVHKLMTNKPFAAAALALASKQLEYQHDTQNDITLRLYQHAVQSLLHYEPSQCGEATLVCCVLLSMYEMMTMTSNPNDWRRHLKGYVFNLANKTWNGSTPGLVGAAFWVFARIDMWAAYLSKQKTLIHPKDWRSHEPSSSSDEIQDSNDYCHSAIVLLARIVNSLSENSTLTETNALWDDLQQWNNQRPSHMLPVRRVDPTGRSPFPAVIYAGGPSICGNTFYHTGCILLLRGGGTRSCPDDNRYNPIWHAKELCGISVTNVSHACWVNQVYPLYIAGLAFAAANEKDEYEQNVAERFALLKHLVRIKQATGWPTSNLAAALRKLWGLE